MPNIISSNKHTRLAFLIIFAITILLRIIYLDKSFSGDELNSVLGAKQNISNMLPYVARSDSYPPLQHLLLHFWLKLGDSETWVRILYCFFGIGTCFVTYLIGKEYVNTKFGLYSLFFASISPQLIQLSQYIRGIIISAFFISLSIYFLIRILKGKVNLLNWGGYLFSSIFALYSSYFIVLIIIAENLYMIFNWRRIKNIIKKWVASQLLIITSLMLGMSFFIKQALYIKNFVQIQAYKEGFFILGFHVGTFVRSILGIFGLDQLFLNNITLSKKWPVPILIIITIICLFTLSMIIFRAAYFFKKFTDSSRISFWFFQSLVIIPVILAMVLRHASNFPVVSRYFGSVSIFFIFIIVGAIFSFKSKRFSNLLFVMLALLFILRLPGIYSPIEQWREAVNSIEKRSNSGDCIVFLEKGKNDYNYYSKLNLPQFIIINYFTRDQRNYNLISIDPKNSTELLNLLRPYERIWVVLTHTKIFGGPDVLQDWFLSNGFKKDDERKFIGVDIILYKGKEAE